MPPIKTATISDESVQASLLKANSPISRQQHPIWNHSSTSQRSRQIWFDVVGGMAGRFPGHVASEYTRHRGALVRSVAVESGLVVHARMEFSRLIVGLVACGWLVEGFDIVVDDRSDRPHESILASTFVGINGSKVRQGTGQSGGPEKI